MPVTWYWGDPGRIAHARLNEEETALCGASLPGGEPLMRPVFPAMRCEMCEELRGLETEVYPNKYIYGNY